MRHDDTALLLDLIEPTGAVGAVLATPTGELRAAIGSAGEVGARVAAAVTRALGEAGVLLEIGELSVASVKAASASRVFARHGEAVVAVELDPRRPPGELEAKLRTRPWAEGSGESLTDRDTTSVGSQSSPTLPPPLPPPPIVIPRSSTPGTPSSRMPAVAPQSRPIPTVPVPPPLPRPPVAARPRAPSPQLSQSQPIPVPPLPPVARASTPPPASTRAQTGPVSVATRPGNTPAPMRPVGSGPVFTGDLEEFGLPDLLELLRNSQRSGLLMCTTSAGVGTIQLSRGLIIGADSPHALDLRDHLLNRAGVDPDQRRALAELSPDEFSDELVETALMARNLIPRDELDRARIARIFSAFREMISWTAGRFSFDPAIAVAGSPALALSAQSILMQIFQEQDEQGR